MTLPRYPYLFLALYLIKYTSEGGAGQDGGARTAIGLWFGETLGYTILLSVIYGASVGWVAKELLHWAEEKKFVDRESFLVFAITLALFIVGTCGMIGSDDVLACFIAGNAFTWDDWFRLETSMILCSRLLICCSICRFSSGLELFAHGQVSPTTMSFQFTV